MPDQDVPYPGWPEFEYVCDSANSGSHGPAFCGLGPGPDCPWCQRKVVMTPEWEAFIADTPNRHQRIAEAVLGNPEVKASLRRHSRFNRGESQERMMNAAIDSTDIQPIAIGTPSTNITKADLQREEAKFQQFKKDRGINNEVEALIASIQESHTAAVTFDDSMKPSTEERMNRIRKSRAEMASYDLDIEALTRQITDDIAARQDKAAAITRTAQKELRRMQRRVFWTLVKDTIIRWFRR